MINYCYFPSKFLLAVLNKKDVIFTDFFDTIAFRRIHSSQIFSQWAKALVYRLDLKEKVVEKELLLLRHNASKELRKNTEEPAYNQVMKLVYESIKDRISLTADEFIRISLETDIDIELGCQYCNNYLIHLLRKAKQRGKKIYIVSDFYLPSKVYNDFLTNIGCEDIIDGIFVSESCNKTKSSGSIYKYVLDNLGIQADRCVMIGDSKHSDVAMAENLGIKGIWYFPIHHKIWTNISRLFKFDYHNRIIKCQSSYLYKNTLFNEYALILYYFAQKLVRTASTDDVKKLAFVSRGGYFLKKVVDAYLQYHPLLKIDTDYCYMSRKVCLTNDADKQNDLKEYLHSFINNGTLATVDEGWYCHSQQNISKMLNIQTMGYYLGVRGKDDGYINCNRKGILFDLYGNKGKPTKYYGVFCTNCSEYEQMLTSDEGSVVSFERVDGILTPVLRENNMEKELYDDIICKWQKRMQLVVRGLCVWNLDYSINEKQLARMILKSSLFASHERCNMLSRLDLDMIDNCNGSVQHAKTFADVHIDCWDIIVNPEMYLGMVCKLQRKIHNSVILNLVYRIAASCLYVYVRILNRF